MTKTGKLRSLAKELKTKYVASDEGVAKYLYLHTYHQINTRNLFKSTLPINHSVFSHVLFISCLQPENHVSALRSIADLQKEVTNIDAQYDGCQEVWSKGEANGFFTEKLLDNSYQHVNFTFPNESKIKFNLHLL